MCTSKMWNRILVLCYALKFVFTVCAHILCHQFFEQTQFLLFWQALGSEGEQRPLCGTSRKVKIHRAEKPLALLNGFAYKAVKPLPPYKYNSALVQIRQIKGKVLRNRERLGQHRGSWVFFPQGSPREQLLINHQAVYTLQKHICDEQ